MTELCWRSLMTLLYWEWHLIPRWLLRSIFAQFPEQLLKCMVSWGSVGKAFHDRLMPGRCVRGFVLPVLENCSAVCCSAADTHLKLLDCVVTGASFLTGCVLECDLAYRRYVAVLCMLYKIRCKPMHPLLVLCLSCMCRCLLHAVLWSHIGTLMRLLALPHDFYSPVSDSVERSWWPRIRWCGTGGFPDQDKCIFFA